MVVVGYFGRCSVVWYGCDSIAHCRSLMQSLNVSGTMTQNPLRGECLLSRSCKCLVVWLASSGITHSPPGRFPFKLAYYFSMCSGTGADGPTFGVVARNYYRGYKM